MKRFLYIAVLLMGLSATAQEQVNSLVPYMATGVSIPNTGNFAADAYVSAEVGLMYDNIAVGAVVGLNNLEAQANLIDSYWYEGKIAVYQPLGYVDGYLVGGVGSYIDSGGVFLEYGAGVSRELNGGVTIFVQVTNWDGTTYLTPGFSFPL